MKGFIWRNRKKIALMMGLALLSGMLHSAPEPLTVSATSNTKQQIKDKEKEKEELEKQQAQNESKLEGLRDVEGDLREDLEDLNTQMNQVVANLNDLEQQIQGKEQEIVETQQALQEAKELEAWQYECMVMRARAMYEYKAENYIAELLSKGTLSGILNAADYISKVAASDRKLMDDYQTNRSLIEDHEAMLQQEKIDLDTLKIAAEAEKNKVSGLISKTSNSIHATEEQISEAEKKALAYEAKIKEAEEDLEALNKKLQEEIALSLAAANAAWRDISEVSFADGDRKLLANLIYCEAGGEPYDGKLAVGAVVINRVLSSKFPDSVVGVIYQNKQFSPVGSGRLEIALTADRANADCYRAADEAMSGMTNVGQCLFFRTPIPGLTGINIGGHVFY